MMNILKTFLFLHNYSNWKKKRFFLPTHAWMKYFVSKEMKKRKQKDANWTDF